VDRDHDEVPMSNKGRFVTLPDGVLVMSDVVGLDGAQILGPCTLGHPTRGDSEPLVLGAGVVVRAYAVLYRGAVLSDAVQIGHGALVREGNTIGERSSVGSGAHLEPGNRIGARTRIHSGCFLSSTTLGDDVFCGPHVVFTDDPHPPCPEYLNCVGGAVVEDGASIGARSVILPGVRIGAGSLIGAGSVVTRDVLPGAVVAGSPARVVGRREELRCNAGIFPSAYAWLGPPGTDDAQVVHITNG
jgi:acetyltransferase-like isoleucine patch superfamily enzyme